MKKIFFICLLIFPFSLSGQSTFYVQRASLFEELPINKNDIVFLGNSITNGGEWSELFDNKHIKNRGISGDVSLGVYNRLDAIVKGKPKKVFLLIGVNDLAQGISPDSINTNICKIVDKIKTESAETKIYLQSVLPVNADFNKFTSHTSKVEEIKKLNALMHKSAKEKGVEYVDLYSAFVITDTDKLKPEFTNDGLHLLGIAYIHWKKILLPYLSEVNKPHFSGKAFTRASLKNEVGFPASTFQSKITNEKKISMKIEILEDYPVKGGVSATFTGVHNNKLIVAGGCNFVEKNSAPVRTFYKDIYCLDLSDIKGSKWKKLKDYPCEIAYGASVSTPEGIVCIGGNTDKGASKKVYILSYDEAKGDAEIKSLPDLEFAVSNAAASLVGRTIYLAGGAIKGEVNNAVFTLDLDKPDVWKHIQTPFEAECQQAVMLFQGDRLFLIGGCNELNAKVFTEILSFDFDKKQWIPFSQFMQHNKPQAMIGGSALAYGNDEVLFVAGVNYDIFRAALERIQKTQQAEKSGDKKLWEELKQAGKEYMSQKPEWYKFRTEILKLNLADKKMEVIGDFPDLARAGAGITLHNNILYIIGGELKPGVRTEKANYIYLK